MKKLWSYVVSCALGVLGFASLIATSPPPPSYFLVETANNEGSYYRPIDEDVTAFACSGEQVRAQWGFYEDDGVTLTANPLGSLSPDLDKQRFANSGEFLTRVLGKTVITLEAGATKNSVPLELIPEDVCKNFPINLIANFSGTLQQARPTQALLDRVLKLRWRDNALQAILTAAPTVQEQEPYTDTRIAPCQLLPDEDKLTCSAGDVQNPNLRLEGIITAEGFTGTYQGFDESTASTVSFEGTFDFKKVEPQPQQPQ
jgi:hypothetical protein